MVDYFQINNGDIKIESLSVLGLAHVGDAVYELMVRLWMTEKGYAKASDLHKATVACVAAPAQARGFEHIMPHLTEDELACYKRGRNAKVHGIPKGASPGEYHSATGLEALFGYLYLTGKKERICQLFELIKEVL